MTTSAAAKSSIGAQFAQRRTERNEACVDALGIGGVGANPNVHVSGGSWQTMRCQSDAANDQEPDIVLQKRFNEVTEIGVHGLLAASDDLQRPPIARDILNLPSG